MKRNKVSKSDITLWKIVSAQPHQWFTIGQLANLTRLNPRTVQLYVDYFVDAGMLNRFEAAKAYRYRWSCVGKDALAYVDRIKEADSVFRNGK